MFHFSDILVPEHVRIAEVGHVACDDRVALILGEGLSVVSTVGHALGLVLTSRGIESHDSTLAEASGILLVDNSRATEYRSYHIWLDSFTLKLPVYKIGRGGDVPRSCSPTAIHKDCTGNKGAIRHPYQNIPLGSFIQP